jgi:hypothetical protein
MANDYNDARELAAPEEKIKNLSPPEYQLWQELNTKYDVRYCT